MKNFVVDVDFTMSKSFEVEAENEEQAMAMADAMISKNPYDYAHNFSHYVSHEVIDVEEDSGL